MCRSAVRVVCALALMVSFSSCSPQAVGPNSAAAQRVNAKAPGAVVAQVRPSMQDRDSDVQAPKPVMPASDQPNPERGAKLLSGVTLAFVAMLALILGMAVLYAVRRR